MHRSLLGFVALLLAACGPTKEEPAASDGRAVFEQRRPDGNSFSCSTCHALEEPAADGIVRVGHPLAGSTRRPGFKNGAAQSFLQAVNFCMTDWLTAPPFQQSDADYQALFRFIDSLKSPAGEKPVTATSVPPPTDLASGDAANGHARFNQTCVACHGADAVGSIRAPSLRLVHNPVGFVAHKIRRSGPSDSVYPGLTGGRMPFYAADRLTDSDVVDLATYVSGLVKLPMSQADGGTMTDGGTMMTTVIGMPGACPSTHPLVGQSRTLTQRAHGVSGTVTLTNDCTVTFTNLNFDGGGIDVRVYGAKGDFYGPTAFAMGPQLFGMPLSGATLHVTLPTGKTLADLDRVSIWCVAARFSFGDALLQ